LYYDSQELVFVSAFHEISSFRRLQRFGEEVSEAGEVLENQYNGGAEVQRAKEAQR
jgi:hypothetical protein